MDETKTEKIFGEGIYFKRPREGASEFVKGSISVKVPDFITFIEKHQNNAGYVNLDLKKSKTGTLYLELNTFQPKKPERKPEPTIGMDGRDLSEQPF